MLAKETIIPTNRRNTYSFVSLSLRPLSCAGIISKHFKIPAHTSGEKNKALEILFFAILPESAQAKLFPLSSMCLIVTCKQDLVRNHLVLS